MNIIHSVWDVDTFRMRDQHKLAALSNFLAQKRGFKTNLYISSKDYLKYWKIKYDNFKILPSTELNALPRTVWSISKILSSADQVEPFLHIDLDVLIYNRQYEFIHSLMDKKFIIYNYEDTEKPETVRSILKYIFENTDNSLDIEVDTISSLNSKNFAIFGTYYKHQVPFIANAAKQLIAYLKKHKSFFESTELAEFLIKEQCPWPPAAAIPIIVEQIIFFNLATKNLSSWDTGSFCDFTGNFANRPSTFKKYMYHIQSNKPIYLDRIDEILQAYNLKY